MIELHGNLDRVDLPATAGTTSAREALDRRLRVANPEFEAEATRINPDGDVGAPRRRRSAASGWSTARTCGGVLKPDVVFFGENVPKSRVERCYRLIDDANAVLVLGSSLTVMSGFRFVRHAAKSGTPVLIINQGLTRGDPYAAHRVNLPLGQALTELTSGCEHHRAEPRVRWLGPGSAVRIGKGQRCALVRRRFREASRALGEAAACRDSVRAWAAQVDCSAAVTTAGAPVSFL